MNILKESVFVETERKTTVCESFPIDLCKATSCLIAWSVGGMTGMSLIELSLRPFSFAIVSDALGLPASSYCHAI